MKAQSISQEKKTDCVFPTKRKIVTDRHLLNTYMLVQLDRCLCPTLLRD